MSATPSPSASKTSVSIVNNYSQTPSSSTDLSQKRSNSSGTFGSGAQTRQVAQPRNSQPLRKQNKAQKRAKLVDDDAIAEVAAMRSINSRKGQTSITHLMNFSLPPRPHYQPQHQHSHQRWQRRNPTWGLGSGYHAVDKARYVHANYRFIVRPDGEYKVQAIDADVYLGWDKVLQILASADTQSTNCPICLSVPVAPRMAKCGHIFCLPCLIRYMHSTDDVTPLPEKRARWKKCPICEDSIYISETRPVRWFVGQEASMLQEGGDVLLKLLRREPGTTLALPRDASESYGHQDDIPWFHIAEVMDYARIMKGGEAYMQGQYSQEIADLELQEKEDELMFGDDTTWTRKAIHSIEEAKSKLQGLGDPPLTKTELADRQDLELREPIPKSWDYDEHGDLQRPNSNISKGIQDLSVQAHPRGSLGGSKATNRTQPFFFYHALPNFFLSPLDIRILKAAFGDFASFPTTILPRVEHISTGHVVDDDLRKRAKYMAHLPYGCEVSLLECDWTDIISTAILDQFKEEIGKRRKRNHEKEAREERDRLRAEKEEDDKRWAAARRRRPSAVQKSFSETDFQPLTAPATDTPPEDSSLASTPPWGNPRTHSSFATLASPGTSPDAPRTVWGTAAINSSSPIPSVIQPKEAIDDGWLQDWEKDLLDENEAVAMVAASIDGEGSSQVVASAKKPKKGKNKKITLMSTNTRRGA